MERVRHIKSGGEYEVLDRKARLQTDKPLGDYAEVVVYRSTSGMTWVRPVEEMNDGRFEPVDPSSSTATGSGTGLGGEDLGASFGPDHSSETKPASSLGPAGECSSRVPADLVSYLQRQWGWSKETFGPALRTKGIVQHIAKELREIEADPHDLAEWVDVIILAMDGFWRHGGKPEDLLPAMQAKQDKNFARTWPDWRAMGEDQAIEHDRSGEAPSPLPAPAIPSGGQWKGMSECPNDGRPVWIMAGSPKHPIRVNAEGENWRAALEDGLEGMPTHWHADIVPPALGTEIGTAETGTGSVHEGPATDDVAVCRALDAFFCNLPHPDKPWGGAWLQQMRDALNAAAIPSGGQWKAIADARSADVYALGPLDPKPLGLAFGCCSATSPCEHQKRDPMTLCTTCERSWKRGRAAHVERIFGPASCDGSAEGGETEGLDPKGNSAVGVAETPEATPSLPPLPMTVEEARQLLGTMNNLEPKAYARDLRQAAANIRSDAAAQVAYLNLADRLETALRLLSEREDLNA